MVGITVRLHISGGFYRIATAKAETGTNVISTWN